MIPGSQASLTAATRRLLRAEGRRIEMAWADSAAAVPAQLYPKEAAPPICGSGSRAAALLADTPEPTDAQIDEHIRTNAETAYHPSCTCRMGTDDMAVTDHEGRVHGVQSLRVVDASIMPDVVSGNLNAPTIMMAEKLADAIRGRKSLPRSGAPSYIHPNYLTQQR